MEKKIKVLLADNSEYFGAPCAMTMRAHNLEVQTIEKDGRHVVDAVGQTKPDVVIMDFFLPGLDAIGVMKGIQNLHLQVRPKLMIMSGFDNPTLEREAMSAGADYYFLKPFDADGQTAVIHTGDPDGGQSGDAGNGNYPPNWCSRSYQRVPISTGCHSHGH